MADPGAPAIARLDAGGFRRTPWKNGGGVTIDVADAYRSGSEPGSWAGMIWRFGRTRIEVSAPFSDLSGIDRILAVIGGGGLLLHASDGQVLDGREPFRPVRFPGEWPITSELTDGPVEVLNLMAARGESTIDLLFLDERPVAVPAGEVVVYAFDGDAACRIGDVATAIPAGDAIRWRSERATSLVPLEGRAAVASVTSARHA